MGIHHFHTVHSTLFSSQNYLVCHLKKLAISRIHLVYPQLILRKYCFHCRGARDGAVVRALTSYQCGPGSNPGVDAICGLRLLWDLSFAPRGFSPDTPVSPSPQKPTFPNSSSIRNRVDEKPLLLLLQAKFGG